MILIHNESFCPKAHQVYETVYDKIVFQEKIVCVPTFI